MNELLITNPKDLDEKYDVVIIGGGPAGLAAAVYASKYKVSTLLIEKKSEIGIPIQCGEFLPSPTEISDILPNAKHTTLLTEYPSSIKRNHTSKIEIYSPSCNTYTVNFKGVVVNREKYDKWLATLAIRNGANIAIKSKAIGITANTVKVLMSNHYEVKIQYEVLIIAAGASSPFKSIILNKYDDYDISYTYQWVMNNLELDSNVIYMFSGLRYSPGAYGWVIPRGSDEANVGVGIRKPYMSKQSRIKDYLNNLVYVHPIVSKMTSKAIVISRIGGVIPVGPPPNSAIKDNMMFIGDVANMVIASIGAGVPTAVISGTLAGKVSAEVINNKYEKLEEFDLLWKKEIGGELSRAYKIRKMMDPFLKSDKLIELALAILRGKYLSEIIRTRIPSFINYLYTLYEKILNRSTISL